MQFYLVFNTTGDFIEFESVNHNIFEYWLENLNASKANCFSMHSNGLNRINDHAKTLNKLFCEMNDFNLQDIVGNFLHERTIEEYLDQPTMNRLHADWATSFAKVYDVKAIRNIDRSDLQELIHQSLSDDIETQSVASIISLLGMSNQYNNINHLLHQFECAFDHIGCSPVIDRWIEFPNPFSKKYCTDHVVNFSLTFNHLGRTLSNKFSYWDHNLEYTDENTFNELLPYTELNLLPPQKIPYSNEYIQWCKQMNQTPSGNRISLGIIPNLFDNLTKYRTIIHRNNCDNNYFTIETKG